jgi:hypothetical protein
VLAAADGDDELLGARELDRAHDVGDAGAAHDQRRAAVDRSVPDRARGVVAVIAGADHLAAHAFGELGDRSVGQHGLLKLLGSHDCCLLLGGRAGSYDRPLNNH